MKKNTNKLISLLLTVIMLIGMIPAITVPAVAADDPRDAVQEMIDNARNGDVITISGITYSGPLVVDGKSIEIFIPGLSALFIDYFTRPGVGVGGIGIHVTNGGSLKITRGQGLDSGVFSVMADIGAKAEDGGRIDIEGKIPG